LADAIGALEARVEVLKAEAIRRELHRAEGENYRFKDLVGIPWRVAFALQDDGWWLRRDNVWHKPNPMPESTTDRCTSAHEYLFHLGVEVSYGMLDAAGRLDPADAEKAAAEEAAVLAVQRFMRLADGTLPVVGG
jgi:hypothetical protein